MAASGLHWEAFEMGRRFETERRRIEDADVRAFAELTGDRNPLHLDDAYARASVFGERVAHGLLGTSVAAGLLNRAGLTRGTLVAFLGLSWDFVAPIRLGTAVGLRLEVTATRPSSKPDRGLVELSAELVDEAGAVLQRGTFKLLVRRRSAAG
jgi:acyl dehydratase